MKIRKVLILSVLVFLISTIIISLLLKFLLGINQNKIISENLIGETITYDKYNFSYVKTKKNHNKTIIFVHGTPGSWNSFENYLEGVNLNEKYSMYSIDRLGFGKSTLFEKNVETSLEEQAKPIFDLISSINNSEIILVGHSLGVSVLTRMLYDDKDNLIDGYLLLAGDLYYKNSDPLWYNYLTNNVFGNFIIGEELAKSNKEIESLTDELKLFNNIWNNTNKQAIYIQAENDNLVNIENLIYMENINRSNIETIRLNEGNHFIVWNNKDVILNSLEKLFN